MNYLLFAVRSGRPVVGLAGRSSCTGPMSPLTVVSSMAVITSITRRLRGGNDDRSILLVNLLECSGFYSSFLVASRVVHVQIEHT